jgi:hypothetical protein
MKQKPACMLDVRVPGDWVSDSMCVRVMYIYVCVCACVRVCVMCILSIISTHSSINQHTACL